jgi:rRNA maturation endonuclease Nob1
VSNTAKRDRSWAKECSGCGRYLTAIEEHYYEHRCEDCEAQEHARLQAWKEGAEDLYLDEKYGG